MPRVAARAFVGFAAGSCGARSAGFGRSESGRGFGLLGAASLGVGVGLCDLHLS